jgi:hypothetical protein
VIANKRRTPLVLYLAGRYSRRRELAQCREVLHALSDAGKFAWPVQVEARWLDGEHQIDDEGKPIGEAGEALVEGEPLRDGEIVSAEDTSSRAAVLRWRFCSEDLQDVVGCDLLVAFSETPRSNASRGGRHVEFGIAMGLSKKLYVIGPRENIFHWHPSVAVHESFQLFLLDLALYCKFRQSQHEKSERQGGA